jgi:hypothetical protein
MQELNIKLWRNREKQWSVEINGNRHEAMAIGMVEELVERAMVGAELSEEVTRRPHLNLAN